jgi:hypothetical protein
MARMAASQETHENRAAPGGVPWRSPMPIIFGQSASGPHSNAKLCCRSHLPREAYL